MTPAQRRRRKPIKITRDLISYAVGLAGIIWETVHRGTERPTLLLAFLAMLALPKVLDRDEKARDEKDRPPAAANPADGESETPTT